MDDRSPQATTPDESSDTLRAKYYDYCSARVADVLLGMSPDQIFVAAEEIARLRGQEGELGYERMVGFATEHISRQLGLPTFEAWCESYRQDPQSIEGQLLGLWESEGRSDDDANP